MKYFFFCVSVIILSKDGKRINRLIHKEACYCRFQQAKRGKINHVIYANFRENASLHPEDYEVIRLLDPRDPLGDLMVLMGVNLDAMAKQESVLMTVNSLSLCASPHPDFSITPSPTTPAFSGATGTTSSD